MICYREECNNETKRNQAKYCSLSCSSLDTRKRGRTPRWIICENTNCLKSFDADSLARKYCSHSCAATVSNRNRVSIKVCKYPSCDERVWNIAQYCSQEHNLSHKWLIKLIEAKTTGKVPLQNKSCKYLIRLDRGWKCEYNECGVTTWQDKEVPLILDHIDGDSTNHTYPNLRLVCGICDMLLPTYKARNIGKGRFSRRQRYANNQSY